MRPIRVGDIEFSNCLVEFAYRCPNGCPRARTCCVGLAVEATRREVRRIDAIMDELAARKPELCDRRGYANVFVEDPPGFLIEPDEEGACPFLERTGRHALCSIHSLALATGRSVPSVKPASCRHWPILLENHPAGGVRVTIQPQAQRIGCVAPVAELPGHPRMYEAFRAEIVELCGEQAWQRLATAARRAVNRADGGAQAPGRARRGSRSDRHRVPAGEQGPR